MAEEDAVSITPIELSETRCFVATSLGVKTTLDVKYLLYIKRNPLNLKVVGTFLEYFDFNFHFLGI